MYFYIYDTFLTDRKFDRILAAIETRLTDLGISGKIGRLTPFTNAKGLIRDETRRGAATIVAVGNDDTVAKVVEGIGDASITLGVIPIGGPNEIAESLGIPEGADACDVLSKRVTQKIDLGSVNGHLFLSQVRLPSGQYTMEGDGKYRITIVAPESETVIMNLRRGSSVPDDEDGFSTIGNPKDGMLDTMIITKGRGLFRMFRKNVSRVPSVIPVKTLSITSESPISVFVDGRKVTNSKISIEVIPERLKVITGRSRNFM